MQPMRIFVSLTLLVVACNPQAQQRAIDRRQIEEPRVVAEPPGPKIPHRPGMEALGGWALKCYDLALKHNAVFGKGGAMVIQWVADRNGDLLQLDFATDSFRGWEINAKGETLADCITRLAREGKVRWSLTGVAPLRLSPTVGEAPESQPLPKSTTHP
jgi:hypothetical protein